MTKPKIIRACTVPQSLGFVEGMLPDLAEKYEVVLVSSPGEYWETLKDSHSLFRGIEIPMQRHISPLNDLKALVRLIKAFRREKPAMVHSMTPKAGLLCMMASRLTGVPVRVHTFTGLIFPTATGLKRKILMATDWLTCACATHIIPEGEGVKNDLLNNGITRKDIRVLGYGNCQGIDLERFNPAAPEVIAEAAKLRKDGIFTFIFIGRIVGDKGINELAQAFSQLFSERQDVRLLLVGHYEDSLDPINEQARQIIKDCPGIEAVGPQKDVRPWLEASDALVFPSYREGFPNVVIEAGAMGLSSIVTDINGSREIIIEGRNGTIIPSHDAPALYAAMKRFVEERESSAHMGRNARPLIASRYEQSYVRNCLLDFYQEIIHR